VLKPGGRLVLVGAGTGNIGPMTRLLGGMFRRRVLRQRDLVVFIAGVERSDLDELRELIEAGKLRPHVECSYRLEEVPQALRHLEEGRARGKVVITMA
jgi:NADPH:quinone reductase-like Zn-dependent oxidoreductase